MSKTYRILVVEDDPLSAAILEDYLMDKYTLAFIDNGEQIFSALSRFRPDLILLDVVMPGINGYEVCRRVRRDERFRDIKIILLSGMASVEDRLEGYEAGADDYLVKPFVNAELNAKIKVFLQLERGAEIDRIKSGLLRLFSRQTRTPLSRILDLAENLEREPFDEDRTRTDAASIAEHGYRLLDFMVKTMFLCELKSGIELVKSCESANQHLKSCIRLMLPKASERGIAIEQNFRQQMQFDADWEQMQKVFIYILDNAIEYSPEKGVITLGLTDRGETCEISVSDQGKGLAPDLADNNFEAYPIPENSTEQLGPRLSLAICHEIVRLHAGDIQAESASEKGTTITIILPQKREYTGAPVTPL